MAEKIEERKEIPIMPSGVDIAAADQQASPSIKAYGMQAPFAKDELVSVHAGDKEHHPPLALIPKQPESPVLPPPETLDLPPLERVDLEDEKNIGDTNLISLKRSNDWFKFPNRVAALYAVMMDYVKTMGSIRNFDAQTKITIDAETFKRGVAGASLTRSIRDSEARKETLNACKSYASGGVAICQGYSMVKERQNIQNTLDADPTGPKPQLDQAQQQFDKAKNDVNLHMGVAEGDPMAQSKQDPTTHANWNEVPEDKKLAFNQAQEKLNQAKANYRQELNTQNQIHASMSEVKARAVSSMADGTFSLLIAMETQVMGEKEKEKALNDTMIQHWNSMRESMAKDKEDAMSQIDRSLQMQEQFHRSTQVHLSSR